MLRGMPPVWVPSIVFKDNIQILDKENVFFQLIEVVENSLLLDLIFKALDISFLAETVYRQSRETGELPFRFKVAIFFFNVFPQLCF